MGDFIATTHLFEFDKLKCLRNDYFHNSCIKCINECPKDAIFIDRGKIDLDISKCNDCFECIGICPSEALSSKVFDQNRFAIENRDPILSTQKSIPTLKVFDESHIIYMALKLKELKVDLSSEDSPRVKEYIDIANQFFEAVGIDLRVEIVENLELNRKRELFRKLTDRVKKDKDNSEDAPLISEKRTLLKEAIIENIDNFREQKVQDFEFLKSKTIDRSCINCTDCVEFCPTNALFKDSSQTTILFQISKCINCSICNDICKFDSIKDTDSVDLIDFARVKSLIKHDMRTCKECKMPFSYSGNSICSRCLEFKDDFEDIFKLAKEI